MKSKTTIITALRFGHGRSIYPCWNVWIPISLDLLRIKDGCVPWIPSVCWDTYPSLECASLYMVFISLAYVLLQVLFILDLRFIVIRTKEFNCWNEVFHCDSLEWPSLYPNWEFSHLFTYVWLSFSKFPVSGMIWYELQRKLGFTYACIDHPTHLHLNTRWRGGFSICSKIWSTLTHHSHAFISRQLPFKFLKNNNALIQAW